MKLLDSLLLLTLFMDYVQDQVVPQLEEVHSQSWVHSFLEVMAEAFESIPNLGIKVCMLYSPIKFINNKIMLKIVLFVQNLYFTTVVLLIIKRTY